MTMAQFKYRLQPLLDLKIERRDEFELALAERRKELAEEQQALAGLECARDTLAARLVEALRSRLAAGKEANGYELSQHTEFLRGLTADLTAAKSAVSAQRFRVQEFEERVVDARRDLTDAAREVDVLKKHRERLESRFIRALEHKEAVEQDEMGGIIFNQKRRAYESSF
jgi:flagellar export protein FliJ